MNAKKQRTVGAVLDTSSLIILAKLQEIEVAYRAFGPLGITPAVFEEAVERGKELGKDDALVIEAAIRASWVRVVSLYEPMKEFAQELSASGAFGPGERQAIAYAKETGTRLIIEERKGRTLARVHGVRYTVLQVLPLEAYIEDKISYERCIDLLDRIAVAMNSDLAILNAIKAAASAIRREREK